jgi:hypothetical protein
MKLYLALILSLFFSFESLAKCKQVPLPIESAFKASDRVVLVSVNEARRLSEKPHNFVATVKIINSFKGNIKPDDILDVNYKSEEHSILMTPGKSYMLFLNPGNYVSICSGSQEYNWSMDKGNLINQLTKFSESGI